MALKGGWEQNPGNLVEDIKTTLGMFSSIRPRFETGDRAWLVVSTNAMLGGEKGGWAVLVGPDTLSSPVLVVQRSADGSYFWCYLGVGQLTLKDGAVEDLGPKISRVDSKDLFRTSLEAQEEATRRNAVRDGT